MELKRLKSGPRPVRLVLDIESDVALSAFGRLRGLGLQAVTDEHDREMPPNYYVEDVGTVTAVEARSFGDDLRRAGKRKK